MRLCELLPRGTPSSQHSIHPEKRENKDFVRVSPRDVPRADYRAQCFFCVMKYSCSFTANRSTRAILLPARQRLYSKIQKEDVTNHNNIVFFLVLNPS